MDSTMTEPSVIPPVEKDAAIVPEPVDSPQKKNRWADEPEDHDAYCIESIVPQPEPARIPDRRWNRDFSSRTGENIRGHGTSRGFDSCKNFDRGQKQNAAVIVTGLKGRMPKQELNNMFAPYTILRVGGYEPEITLTFERPEQARMAINKFDGTTPPGCTTPLSMWMQGSSKKMSFTRDGSSPHERLSSSDRAFGGFRDKDGGYHNDRGFTGRSDGSLSGRFAGFQRGDMSTPAGDSISRLHRSNTGSQRKKSPDFDIRRPTTKPGLGRAQTIDLPPPRRIYIPPPVDPSLPAPVTKPTEESNPAPERADELGSDKKRTDLPLVKRKSRDIFGSGKPRDAFAVDKTVVTEPDEMRPPMPPPSPPSGACLGAVTGTLVGSSPASGGGTTPSIVCASPEVKRPWQNPPPPMESRPFIPPPPLVQEKCKAAAPLETSSISAHMQETGDLIPSGSLQPNLQDTAEGETQSSCLGILGPCPNQNESAELNMECLPCPSKNGTQPAPTTLPRGNFEAKENPRTEDTPHGDAPPIRGDRLIRSVRNENTGGVRGFQGIDACKREVPYSGGGGENREPLLYNAERREDVGPNSGIINCANNRQGPCILEVPKEPMRRVFMEDERNRDRRGSFARYQPPNRRPSYDSRDDQQDNEGSRRGCRRDRGGRYEDTEALYTPGLKDGEYRGGDRRGPTRQAGNRSFRPAGEKSRMEGSNRYHPDMPGGCTSYPERAMVELSSGIPIVPSAPRQGEDITLGGANPASTEGEEPTHHRTVLSDANSNFASDLVENAPPAVGHLQKSLVVPHNSDFSAATIVSKDGSKEDSRISDNGAANMSNSLNSSPHTIPSRIANSRYDQRGNRNRNGDMRNGQGGNHRQMERSGPNRMGGGPNSSGSGHNLDGDSQTFRHHPDQHPDLHANRKPHRYRRNLHNSGSSIGNPNDVNIVENNTVCTKSTHNETPKGRPQNRDNRAANRSRQYRSRDGKKHDRTPMDKSETQEDKPNFKPMPSSSTDEGREESDSTKGRGKSEKKNDRPSQLIWMPRFDSSVKPAPEEPNSGRGMSKPNSSTLNSTDGSDEPSQGFESCMPKPPLNTNRKVATQNRFATLDCDTSDFGEND